MPKQETVDRLWADLDDVLGIASNGNGTFVRRKACRIASLFSRSRHMQDFITQPQFYEAAASLLS